MKKKILKLQNVTASGKENMSILTNIEVHYDKNEFSGIEARKVDDFMSFLHDMNITENYMAGLMSKYRIVTKSNVRSHILSVLRKSDGNTSNFINGSFTWSDTPDNHNFWEAVNNRWKNYLMGNAAKPMPRSKLKSRTAYRSIW